MEKDSIVFLRDTLYKSIKYFNKAVNARINPPLIIRLDNDVRIDTTQCAVLWDDDKEMCYYFGSMKPFSQVQAFGADHIEYKAILSSFDYGEIQEMYLCLNNEAFGQAVAAINANASTAKPTFIDQSQPVTEDQYRQLWQKFIDIVDPNKINNEYKINASIYQDLNDGSGTVFETKISYTGTKLKLVDATELGGTGGTFKEWNTAKDGSGRSYPVGYELAPTSKSLTLYAIWGE